MPSLSALEPFSKHGLTSYHVVPYLLISLPVSGLKLLTSKSIFESDPTYWITIKGNGDLSREEINKEITKEEYEALKSEFPALQTSYNDLKAEKEKNPTLDQLIEIDEYYVEIFNRYNDAAQDDDEFIDLIHLDSTGVDEVMNHEDTSVMMWSAWVEAKKILFKE